MEKNKKKNKKIKRESASRIGASVRVKRFDLRPAFDVYSLALLSSPLLSWLRRGGRRHVHVRCIDVLRRLVRRCEARIAEPSFRRARRPTTLGVVHRVGARGEVRREKSPLETDAEERTPRFNDEGGFLRAHQRDAHH